ncbi:MAG TPA: fatty acid oxidation complex subunit alpha FadJ [Gemmatimonadaceae bacterium]|nr:fatty acid oxidation complex subunit alpha FadJ [Gemmatimonadaceae bacterium]
MTVTATPYALRTEIDDGVAVITFDLPGEPVNKIGRQVKDEFTAMFERLERDESVRAAVLISGKPDIFIAGADIEEFLEVETAEDAERMSREGQELLDRLEHLRLPVVAAIHGACLGGGLETALACHYRIISDHPKTVLALPEVQLGLIPGAGGTQRLPRLVGLRNALDMILTGRNVRGRKAMQIGLANEMVHPAILRDLAVRRARELGEKRGRTGSGRGGGAAGVLLEGNPIGRSVVFRQAREQTLKKTRGHYPAPLAALDAVRAGYSGSREAGYRAEARLFGEMAATGVSRNLVFLFFASTALKRDPGVSEPAPPPLPVRKIGILGAGFMGAGIASVAVQQGTAVRLKDTEHERVMKGLAAVREVVKERLARRQITRAEFESMLALAGGTVDFAGFGNVDLVIEAVFEELKVKQDVLREVEPLIPEHAIFASNTSTIPIGRIAQASARPDRVIGMHFFSPVHKMPLLEVIRTDRTDPEVIVTVVAYGKKLGKTVIVVNDGPGFYANRILAAYMNEAGKLLDEGARIEAVDRALVDFGFPVGPMTLLDEVGIDVAAKAGNVISDAFGTRMVPSQSLQRVVSAGRYGRKSKKGFYVYDAEGKKGKVDESVYELLPTGTARSDFGPEEIRERTVLALVNEAVLVLEDGIIRSPRDGDVGAVFGIGFPPFRGGPFRYIDALGAESVVRRLDDLHERFAPRFRAADLLRDMARKRQRFYPERGRPVD